MSDHHHHHAEDQTDRRLSFSLVLNGVIVVAEIIGGLLSGSIALLSDALHNLTDVAALAMARIARKLGRRPPSLRHTYGLGRVEALSALANAAAILVVCTLVCREAVIRILHPEPVCSVLMLVVASIGLAANLASVFLLKGHGHADLNTLQQDIQQHVPDIGLHHIHVWEVRPGNRFMTAHVEMDNQLLSEVDLLLQQIWLHLQIQWSIGHVVLEPEFAGCGNKNVLGSGNDAGCSV